MRPTLLLALLAEVLAAPPGDDPRSVFLRPGVRASVPLEEILPGGPPVDGIPALSAPRKVPAAGAEGLSDEDEVLGITLGGEAAAYPIRLLNWHEIVNDTVGGVPVAVTYCPLCRSGIAFERRLDGKEVEFGVSGLLYKSDLLMYDRRTKSLWSQVIGRAVVGPATGTVLKRLPAVRSTWKGWRELHPETTVAGFDTGHARDYGRDPYEGYEKSRALYFPTSPEDERLHPKEPVFGVVVLGEAAAVPVKEVRRLESVSARIGGRAVTFRYRDGVRAFAADGSELPGTEAYWFAWAAFHPGTRLLLEAR